MQKARQCDCAGGLFLRILLSQAVNSSQADPPARSSHDDGDDDDGERESACRKT